MTSIHSRDLGYAQALSSTDDRRINGTQRQVAVARDQLGDPHPVRRRHRLDGERATCEVAEKADLRYYSKPGSEQIDDFGDDQGGNDERSGVCLEQLE